MSDEADATTPTQRAAVLLAVDLGLRTGFAVWDRNGRLQRYGSRNFGTRSRLRGGAEAVLREAGEVAVLVVEGDRDLGQVWGRRAARRGARVESVAPETWRAALLHPRERRTGTLAKQAADEVARRVIAARADGGVTALRHDAAEAVLIGLWGLVAVGWLDALPPEADPRRR